MATDPNLAADNSLFMEATTGDGGTHSAPQWWLSPDVSLPGDQATAGAANAISLRVHKNANPLPAGTGDVLIEVWVGNPSLAMAPNVNTVLVGTQPVPAASLAGGVATATQSWTPGGSGSAPDAPGHRCLIARCFSDTMSPDGANFYLPEDRHYVQHNITVVTTPPAPKKISISTGNGNLSDHEAVTIQVLEDLRPSRFVQAVATNALQKVRTFERFATTPSKSFSVDVTKFDRQIAATHRGGIAVADVLRPGVNVADVIQPGIAATRMLTPGVTLRSVLKTGVSLQSVVKTSVPKAVVTGTQIEAAAITTNLKKDASTGLFGRLSSPNVTAKFTLPPKAFNTFDFTADVSKSKPGTAHIYHLTHVGGDRKPRGGLTVIVVVK